MTHAIPLFHFRLTAGHSIRHAVLLKLWSAACLSDEVSVSRAELRASARQPGHVYSLHGPARIENIYDVEDRLRQSLLTALPKATFVLMRY